MRPTRTVRPGSGARHWYLWLGVEWTMIIRSLFLLATFLLTGCQGMMAVVALPAYYVEKALEEPMATKPNPLTDKKLEEVLAKNAECYRKVNGVCEPR